tara:strand:+ start:16 stop:1161 length:1146 start_codon:yes stop_codon:yes gene_type:complete
MVTRVPNTELLAIKDQFGIQDPFLLKDYNDYMMDLVEEAKATGGVPAVTQGGGGESGIFSGVTDFRSGAPGAKRFLFKDDDTPVDIRNITDKDFFSRIFGDAYDPYKQELSGIQVSGLEPQVPPFDSLDEYLKASGTLGTQTIPDAPVIKEAIPEKKGLSKLFDQGKKGIGSLKDFIMGGGFTGNILRGLIGERDPRFTGIRSYYGGDDRSNLDDIGRIKSGLMAGYAPVSGGLRLGSNFKTEFIKEVINPITGAKEFIPEYTYTGGTIGGPVRYGLQRAYQKRIDNYNKYIARNEKKLQDKFSQKLFDKIQRQKKIREKLAREKAAELRVLQEAQRRKDFKTAQEANERYRDDPGAKSYSGGFDRQTGNYDDPFDPGFAD